MSRTRVYVGRLSPRVRQDDLLEVFEYYGRVLSCDIKNGFAFIEYDDPRDAEDAVYEEHNRDLQGTRMIVEFAKGGGGGRGPPRGGPPGGPRFGWVIKCIEWHQGLSNKCFSEGLPNVLIIELSSLVFLGT